MSAVSCLEEHSLRLSSHLSPALTPAHFLYLSLLSTENLSQSHCSGCWLALLSASVISLNCFVWVLIIFVFKLNSRLYSYFSNFPINYLSSALGLNSDITLHLVICP